MEPPHRAFFANVFRQNAISGIIDYGMAKATSGGFTIETNAGSSAATANPDQLFMNIMDSNIVTGATYAFRFISTTASGPGGVFDTILWNNFASSDGLAGSIAISLNSSDTDTQPFLDEITNLWQNFDETASKIIGEYIPPP